MTKIFAVMVTALVLSASAAMAAAPAAPVFTLTAKTTKVANGVVDSHDGKQLVVDGNNLYVAYADELGQPCVIRSTDGGITWGAGAILSTFNASGTVRIAMTKDPLSTTKKIISVTWQDVDGIRYSYFVDRPTGTAWSVPVVIVPFGEGWSSKLVSAPNGSLHYFSNNSVDGLLYYATAASAESHFSAPKALSFGMNSVNFSIAADSLNNLYLSETEWDAAGNGTLAYHKLAGGIWSSVIVATTVVDDNNSIAVYDANNIYIAYKVYNLATSTINMWLATTTDGGKTWTKRVIAPNSTVYGTYPSLTVSSSKVLTLVGHYVNWGADGRITINRSTDSGLTWSVNSTVSGNCHPSIALDSAGKACILSGTCYFPVADQPFFNGASVGAMPIYFTREK